MTAARLVALGLGAGLAPRAPGTAGSLLGLLLGAVLLWEGRAPLAVATLGVTLLGLWSIREATGQPWRGSKGAQDDPGWIVIDEVAGQMLAVLALPRPSWLGLAIAFALFRAFDIDKPWPIRWIDRRGGVIAIMADDLVAGLAAATVMLIGQAILHDLMAHDFP